MSRNDVAIRGRMVACCHLNSGSSYILTRFTGLNTNMNSFGDLTLDLSTRFYLTLLRSRSWKSKLKSMLGEIPFIRMPVAFPSSSIEKVANASQFMS